MYGSMRATWQGPSAHQSCTAPLGDMGVMPRWCLSAVAVSGRKGLKGVEAYGYVAEMVAGWKNHGWLGWARPRHHQGTPETPPRHRQDTAQKSRDSEGRSSDKTGPKNSPTRRLKPQEKNSTWHAKSTKTLRSQTRPFNSRAIFCHSSAIKIPAGTDSRKCKQKRGSPTGKHHGSEGLSSVKTERAV